MKQQELKKLINAGLVGSLSLLNQDGKSWEVWASGKDGDDALLRAYGLNLKTERGDIKTYTSLDRALVALRALGWNFDVIIQG
jgi:hypothetical protein